MRTNDSKTSVDSKLEEMEEKYPVEQIAVKNNGQGCKGGCERD